MKKQGKTAKNYLDFVPAHSENIEWKQVDNGMVQLILHRTGFFNRVSQKLFGAPKLSYIDLDELGSYVWQQIDGQKTVYEIGVLVKDHFGESAGPVFERLVKYMKLLSNNHFIYIIGSLSKTGDS
jgi:hypothetical protein